MRVEGVYRVSLQSEHLHKEISRKLAPVRLRMLNVLLVGLHFVHLKRVLAACSCPIFFAFSIRVVTMKYWACTLRTANGKNHSDGLCECMRTFHLDNIPTRQTPFTSGFRWCHCNWVRSSYIMWLWYYNISMMSYTNLIFTEMAHGHTHFACMAAEPATR